MLSPSPPNHTSSNHSHSLPAPPAWNTVPPCSRQGRSMSARASLVCCPLISLTSPFALPYLSEAALTTSLQASLLPGTPFLIDLSEPPASGSSPSQALLAAPVSSPPARALLPAHHVPLPGVTFLLGTCHCSVPRVSVQRGRTPGGKAFVYICPVPGLGSGTGSVRRASAEVLPCCCLA